MTMGELFKMDEHALLRLGQIVPTLFPVNRATWWAWCKKGHAPAPLKLGPGVTVWRAGDLRAFMARQAEAAAQPMGARAGAGAANQAGVQ